MEVSPHLAQFPSLKTDKFNQLRENAVNRVLQRLGEKPERYQYDEMVLDEPSPYVDNVRWRDLIEPMDWVIPAILLPLLLVSLSHLFSFSGELAARSYKDPVVNFSGIWLSSFSYTLIHQIGLFGITELGVLFFYTQYTFIRRTGHIFAKIYLALAVLCAIVVLYANVVSLAHNATSSVDYGVAVFIGLLVPAITLTLGERVSEIVRKQIELQQEAIELHQQRWQEYRHSQIRADEEYQRDLAQWLYWSRNPHMYDENNSVDSFNIYLAKEIIEFYKRTRLGLEFQDWTLELERQLAAREIAASRSVNNLEDQINFFTSGADKHS